MSQRTQQACSGSAASPTSEYLEQTSTQALQLAADAVHPAQLTTANLHLRCTKPTRAPLGAGLLFLSVLVVFKAQDDAYSLQTRITAHRQAASKAIKYKREPIRFPFHFICANSFFLQF